MWLSATLVVMGCVWPFGYVLEEYHQVSQAIMQPYTISIAPRTNVVVIRQGLIFCIRLSGEISNSYVDSFMHMADGSTYTGVWDWSRRYWTHYRKVNRPCPTGIRNILFLVGTHFLIIGGKTSVIGIDSQGSSWQSLGKLMARGRAKVAMVVRVSWTAINSSFDLLFLLPD